ncbi:MAG: hypothetical protein KIT84_29830 [Labilithrix sp.]|nr:hypothetical protein [Labilithrix sp.]MCW5815264.1 hypothetical protein [Labilithrix sp.]
MQKRPLLVLAALAAASEPDFGASALERLKTGLRERYDDDPIGTSLSTVVVASWLFYKAEAGHNPQVTSFHDALTFVSTSLSAGYGDVRAQTSTGKTIASLLMTIGPAMTKNLLDEPAKARRQEESDRAVIDRLDRILAALEARASA